MPQRNSDFQFQDWGAASCRTDTSYLHENALSDIILLLSLVRHSEYCVLMKKEIELTSRFHLKKVILTLLG